MRILDSVKTGQAKLSNITYEPNETPIDIDSGTETIYIRYSDRQASEKDRTSKPPKRY